MMMGALKESRRNGVLHELDFLLKRWVMAGISLCIMAWKVNWVREEARTGEEPVGSADVVV